MIRDEQADLARKFVGLYERAGETTPSGRVPTMVEVAHQREIIARAAQAAGCYREFLCARDGGLDLQPETENVQ